MSSSNETSYFDLHITGLGYLNRVREVTPKQGKPFLACDVVALKGLSTNVQYCRFDVTVSGTEAQDLVRRCKKAVEEQRKVLIGFRLGDLYAESFMYRTGDRAGQYGVSLKARLLFISWVKVDNVQVYKAEPKSTDEPGQISVENSAPVAEPIAADSY
ncbi:STY4534 family ICE replication protein [Pseudomonas huaxiensis]|uniref:STY4534 family ICE replication protein n=1 Tax=Pseudomonas huaxiensis TaxID=2213017 RepID=UPI000DA68304|nr:STY4534 family ICE replication protein [Pseudomonas huaxiensis]